MKTQRGFTLLDLLVILAVLFLLTAILLPALRLGRQRSQSERCLHNLNQLTRSWLMYASANGDACCNNFGVSQTAGNAQATWCADVMDWTVNPQNTNVALPKSGQLSPYIDADPMRFKCSADVYLSPAQTAARFKYRVRSYSMSAFFGHFSNGGDPTYQGKDWIDPNYRQFVKVTDVPTPSSMFLFLDEHPDSINDGYFAVGTIPTKWTALTPGEFEDVPGSLHVGAGGFSFSDGHSELHRWQDYRRPGNLGAGISGQPVTYSSRGDIVDTPPFTDIHWVWQHSSIPFQP